MCNPDDRVYLIYYDDRDRQPEILIGERPAQARFEAISRQWNAHLFVKVQSNSRDDPYADRNVRIQPPTQWPTSEDVGRLDDMGQGNVRVGFDSDKDVFLEIFSNERGAVSLEFCNPGAGGGMSPRTRMALIALMKAIEEDNAERPSFAWPPRRSEDR